jgi:hypothetical protein
MLASLHNFRVIQDYVFVFYRAEWDQTYKQIYSDDTVAQVKGFERLLVWKARCACFLLYTKKI